jgi:twitching motility protein PilT
MLWSVENMLELMNKQSASDIVFVPGAPPAMWVRGQMRRVSEEALTNEIINQTFLPIMTPAQKQRLDEQGDADFSVGKPGVGRMRINIHRQRGSYSVATRFIPREVPIFENLKLPGRVLDFADLARGIVLVTGGAGTGKSTTLAAMVEHMNRTYAYHIITLEDPVEFTFSHRKSVIEQRQIGDDCPTFSSALRCIVRQRPDVILLGEMRDLETISAALTAAEIGHLVLASLHTVSAVETMNRIIDVFPANQQNQIRVQLASTLQGVVCQTLFPDEKDNTRIPACEILIPTPAIRRAIRDNEMHLVAGMIETGRSSGMQTMDVAIAELISAGHITLADGLAKAHNPDKLAKLVA